MSDALRYDRRSILLHWVSAGAVVLLWLIAQGIDYFPREMRFWPRSVHVLVGLILLGVYVSRVVWKLTGARRLPPAEGGVLGAAAIGVHHVLYLLIAVTLALGITLEAIRADNLFGLGSLPSIAPGDRALTRTVNFYHEWAANGMLILAGLHGCAALFHHVVKKDGVLRRMLPG